MAEKPLPQVGMLHMVKKEKTRRATHEETMVTSTDGVHGIRYNKTLQQLEYYDEETQIWEPIPINS